MQKVCNDTTESVLRAFGTNLLQKKVFCPNFLFLSILGFFLEFFFTFHDFSKGKRIKNMSLPAFGKRFKLLRKNFRINLEQN